MNVVVNGPRTAVATLKIVEVGDMVMAVAVLRVHDTSLKLACNELTCNFQVTMMYAQKLNSRREDSFCRGNLLFERATHGQMQFHAATSQSFPHSVCTLTHYSYPIPYPVAQHLGSTQTLIQLGIDYPEYKNRPLSLQDE